MSDERNLAWWERFRPGDVTVFATQALDEIARASREQAASIEEVTVAVRTMDEMTQHNAALVEETNAAIEQTEGQANHLDDLVGVFRTAVEVGFQHQRRARAA